MNHFLISTQKPTVSSQKKYQIRIKIEYSHFDFDQNLSVDFSKIRYKKDFWNENIIMEGVNYKLKWIV